MVNAASADAAVLCHVDGDQSHDGVRVSMLATPDSALSDASNPSDASHQQSDTDPLQAQGGDLEDQTLPAPFATLALDWHPFPHLYPHVNGGTSAFIGPLRPPPLV